MRFRRIALAAGILGILQAAIHWRSWTPIHGARRAFLVDLAPLPLYGVPWPILHAWILALGVWLWTRDRSPTGAATAAAVASFAFYAAPEWGLALGVTWIPWCLWAAERFATARAPAWGALAALFVVLTVAGGLPARTAPMVVAPLALRLPVLYLGFVPLLALAAARSRRAIFLAAGLAGALVLGRPSIAVILGAGLAAEGIERIAATRDARLVVGLGAAIALAAAVATAWLSHLPNRAEAPRDLAAIVFAEAAVASWALWQVARDERKLFTGVLAAIAALSLWFDHHERLERCYRLRASQSPIAISARTSTTASAT